MDPICYVIGSGPFYGPAFSPRKVDLVIAADGGYTHLKRIGVAPDLLLGDFDSLSLEKEKDGLSLPDCETVRLPMKKDDTDMLYALRTALARGYRRFRLYGGAGGRVGHTLANIQLLAFLAHRNARGVLFGEDCAMTAFSDGALCLPAAAKGYVSVFALSDVCTGVEEEGLLYTLHDARLTNDLPLGVSNEFIGQPSRIRVRSGTLLVVCEQDVLALGEA